MRKYLLLLSLFPFLLSQGQAAELTLVKAGVPRAIIAIAEDPDEHEQLALDELDASEQVKPGKNLVVICVSNNRANEIGTGGILALVMWYAPQTGKEAELANIRDLKSTFP
jgi:hypothetical protein